MVVERVIWGSGQIVAAGVDEGLWANGMELGRGAQGREYGDGP